MKRHDNTILARLRQLDTGSAAEIVVAEVERAEAQGANLRHLTALTALESSRLAALIETLPLVVTPSGFVFSVTKLDRMLAQIPALLALHPAGLAPEKLAAAIRGSGPEMLDFALDRLTTQGAIVRRESRYLIPRPEEDRLRARDEAALAGQIEGVLRHGGLMPPRPAEIITDAASKRAVDRLIREGTVVRAVDRAKRKEILFHREAIDEARRRLEPLLEHGQGLLVTEICAALGISRKFAMPLLDHLDTIRFTRRIGDRRQLNVVSPASR